MGNFINYEKALQGLTVLCCEDDKDARTQLEFIFKKRVSKVYIAEDGQDGFYKYKQFRPDLVISDIKMPKWTGLEMSRRIKELNPKAQIILLTAFDYKNFFLDAIDIGISQYVQKPIGERKLFDAINRCIDIVLAEKKINYQVKYIQSLLDAQKNLLFVTDGKRLIAANKSMIDFSGFKSFDELSQNVDSLNDRIYYEDFEMNKETWIETIYGNRIIKRKRLVLVYPSGTKKHFTVNVSVLPDFIGRFLVSLTNISHIKETELSQIIDDDEKEEKIEEKDNEKTNIDTLTGAFNKSGFMDMLEDVKEKAKTTPLIILLYINNLSEINIEYGFDTGDEVLKKSVRLIHENFTENYIVGRIFGGDFAIIPSTTNMEEIKSNAFKLKKIILSKLSANIDIKCSVNISKIEDKESYGEFLRRVQKKYLAGDKEQEHL